MNHIFYETTFGVEIETVGIARSRAAEIIANYYGTRTRYAGSHYDTYEAYTRDGRAWKCMKDGSLSDCNGGCEVVTPILRYEDMDDLQNIVRALRSAGARVDSSCGLHVHIGADRHDAYTLTRLCNMMLKRQPLINDALQNWDRSTWCKPLKPALVSAMRSCPKTKEAFADVWYGRLNDGGDSYRSYHYNQTRYHGINLHAYYTKGTVEFRLFNGTLHAGKIKAYVQFCLAMSTYAIGSNETMHTNCSARFENTANMTPIQKYKAMVNFLENRLDLKGAEFATCRTHMTAALKQAANLAA